MKRSISIFDMRFKSVGKAIWNAPNIAHILWFSSSYKNHLIFPTFIWVINEFSILFETYEQYAGFFVDKIICWERKNWLFPCALKYLKIPLKNRMHMMLFRSLEKRRMLRPLLSRFLPDILLTYLKASLKRYQLYTLLNELVLFGVPSMKF